MSRRDYNPFETETKVGFIQAIDYENDTCDVKIDGVVHSGVWIHYHCDENEVDKGGSSPFGIGDKVLCLVESSVVKEVFGWADGVRLACTSKSFYAFRYTENRIMVIHQLDPERLISAFITPGINIFNKEGGVHLQFDEKYFNVLHIVQYDSYINSYPDNYIYNFTHKILRFYTEFDEANNLINLKYDVIQDWTSFQIPGLVLAGWVEFTFNDLKMEFAPKFTFSNGETNPNVVPDFSSEIEHSYDLSNPSFYTTIDEETGLRYVQKYYMPGQPDSAIAVFDLNAYEDYYFKKTYKDQSFEQKCTYSDIFYPRPTGKNEYKYPPGLFPLCGETQVTGTTVDLYLDGTLLKSIPQEKLLGEVGPISNGYWGLYDGQYHYYCKKALRKQINKIEVSYSGKFIYITIVYVTWAQVATAYLAYLDDRTDYCNDLKSKQIYPDKVRSEVHIFKNDTVIHSAKDINLDDYLNFDDFNNIVLPGQYFGYYAETDNLSDTSLKPLPYASQPFNLPKNIYDCMPSFQYYPTYSYPNYGFKFKMYYSVSNAFSYGGRKDWYEMDSN